jgi:two-component system, NarL family, response regulator LiaR
MTTRILIVDDHKVVRQGLRMFLALDSQLEIAGEAASGEEAVQRTRELHPRVVLMDLLLPGMDGIQATAQIRAEMPEVEVIALTSVPEEEGLIEAVRAGAIAYVRKDTEAEALCQAIHAAAAGQAQFSPQAAARLVREVRHEGSKPPQPLTERETDILRLVASGLANKEIAGRLEIGETTVKTHVSNILAKLGVPSRTQAALYAVREGLVSEGLAPERLVPELAGVK